MEGVNSFVCECLGCRAEAEVSGVCILGRYLPVETSCGWGTEFVCVYSSPGTSF